MRTTDGGLTTGSNVTRGEETEIRGYVNTAVEDDFSGDTVWVIVNMGNDAAALFQNGTAVISSYSEDWEPGGNGEAQVNAVNGLMNFRLQCKSVVPAPTRVEFGIKGTISDVEGTAEVTLIEEDSVQGSKADPLRIPVSKTAGYQDVSFFLASRPDSPTEPACIFETAESILFQWDGSGTQYRIFEDGANGLLYEGDGHSFEHQVGICRTTVFILEEVSKGKTVQYKTLTLKVGSEKKVVSTVGVQDGKGLNFVFGLREDWSINYWSWRDDEKKPFHRGQLICKGSVLSGEYPMLWADRLPDGRVIVVSAIDSILCYQIQTEAGKAGFGRLHVKDFSGGDRKRIGSSFLLSYGIEFGIVSVRMGLTTTGLRMFVHYWDILHESNNQSGVYYAVLTGDEDVDFSKFIAFDLAKEAQGEHEYYPGDCIGVNVINDKVRLYYGKRSDMCIEVYDPDSGSDPVIYTPEGDIKYLNMENMQDGGTYGIICKFLTETLPQLSRIVLNEKEHKYAREILAESCGRYFFNTYTDDSGKQEMFYVYEESEVDPSGGIANIYTGFADDSGVFKFEQISLVTMGCSLKHKTGKPVVFGFMHDSPAPPNISPVAYDARNNFGA